MNWEELENPVTELEPGAGEGLRAGNIEDNIEEPTQEETTRVIKQLKNHKAAGEDGVNRELLKYGGQALYECIHSFLKRVWEREEIPDEWNTTLFVSFHKKRDKTECKNNRGLSHLSTRYKVFAKILYRNTG